MRGLLLHLPVPARLGSQTGILPRRIFRGTWSGTGGRAGSPEPRLRFLLDGAAPFSMAPRSIMADGRNRPEKTEEPSAAGKEGGSSRPSPRPWMWNDFVRARWGPLVLPSLAFALTFSMTPICVKQGGAHTRERERACAGHIRESARGGGGRW